MAKTLYNPDGLGQLDPDDYNAFQTRRRQAQQSYDIGTAQNQWKRDTADQEYASATSDLRRQYGRARRQFGSNWTKRGMLNSGLHDKAYQDLQVDRQQGLSDLLRQYNQSRSGLELADRQLSTILWDSVVDVNAAEEARRQSVAAALNYAKENG